MAGTWKRARFRSDYSPIFVCLLCATCAKLGQTGRYSDKLADDQIAANSIRYETCTQRQKCQEAPSKQRVAGSSPAGPAISFQSLANPWRRFKTGLLLVPQESRPLPPHNPVGHTLASGRAGLSTPGEQLRRMGQFGAPTDILKALSESSSRYRSGCLAQRPGSTLRSRSAQARQRSIRAHGRNPAICPES